MSKQRSIFEEVDEKVAAPTTGGIDQRPKGARSAIRAWLIALFSLLVIMIAVGGLTRLTNSGLSITEWRPITGALPPLSAEAWEAEFELYRQIPEYQLQNNGMSLSEFQFIYWWEWGHRQLGRVIGLVWAIGFFFFLATRKIPPGWTPRLFGIGVLGGIQGAIGWWMVSSGLTGTMLDVASYRLATHLGLAFLILGLIAWYIFQLSRSERELMSSKRVGACSGTHLRGCPRPDRGANLAGRACGWYRRRTHIRRLAPYGRGHFTARCLRVVTRLAKLLRKRGPCAVQP